MTTLHSMNRGHLRGNKNIYLVHHPSASSSTSSILEPTPIDPTGIVTVQSVPLASSSLWKAIDESFLASMSDLLLGSCHGNSQCRAATPVHDPSTPAACLWGLVDVDLEQSSGNKQKLVDVSIRSARGDLGWWSDDAIQELRKMNMGSLNHHDDYNEYHDDATASPLLIDCATNRLLNFSQFMVHRGSPEPTSKITSQNNRSPPPLPSVESVENEEWRNNQHAERTHYRANQSHQWYKRYLDLTKFRKKYGHCLVPLNWTENPSLAHWVKRQRYQYRAKQENRHSTLTADRQEMLERLGFVWDSHALGWEARWNELREFKQKYGHCSVPKNFSANMQLATWVKCQRRQFKLYCEGKDSNMTKARIGKLDSLCFDFTPRKQDLGMTTELVTSPPLYYHDECVW